MNIKRYLYIGLLFLPILGFSGGKYFQTKPLTYYKNQQMIAITPNIFRFTGKEHHQLLDFLQNNPYIIKSIIYTKSNPIIYIKKSINSSKNLDILNNKKKPEEKIFYKKSFII